MPAWIVVPYLAIGLLISVGSYFFMERAHIRRTEREIDRVTGAAIYQLQGRGAVRRVRRELLRFLVIPTSVVAWPGALAAGIRERKSKHRQTMAAIALAPASLYVAVSSAGFAALLVALRLVSGPHWALDVGCVALLTALLGLFAHTVISGHDLAAQVRRNLMQPYLQFALFTACTYLTLLACVILIEASQGELRLSRTALWHQVQTLGAFKYAVQSLVQVPRTALAVLLTVTGVAYFIMVVQQLSQFRQFKRQPGDHAFLIMGLIDQQKYDAARKRLDELDEATRNEQVLITPELALLFVEGRHVEAYRKVEGLYGLRAGGRTLLFRTRTTDDALWFLLVKALRAGLEPARYRELLKFALDQGISDGCLALLLPMFLRDAGMASATEVSRSGIDEARCPICAQLAELVVAHATRQGPHDQITDFLELALGQSYSQVQLRTYERIAAMIPVAPADRAVRLIVLTRLRVDLGWDPVETLSPLLAELDAFGDAPSWIRLECGAVLEDLRRWIVSLEPELADQIALRRRALLEGASADELAAIEAFGVASWEMAGRAGRGAGG
jgi:hypothetical protein